MIGREVDGKYRNFDKFPLLSLLADTSGGSKLSKSKFWKVWLLHLDKLINLGWVVWHVLVETLIQMMHLRMTHTVFLMIWNVLGSEGLGGRQLGAVVVTFYKFKLANGLAVFRLSLTAPKA